MPLTIEVELLLNRFAGSDGHDDTPPEWPPAPARLFSALVAACQAQHAEALTWLERQGPPRIYAGGTCLPKSQSRWLVTNRTDRRGRSADHPGRKNVMRTRHRRWADEPRIIYSWPDASPEPEVFAALDSAARRVPYLGRSSSPAAVRVIEEEPQPSDTHELWQAEIAPALDTIRLRVPYPGFLDQLILAYEAGDRVDPPVYEEYRRVDPDPPTPDPGVAAGPWEHMIVLRLEQPLNLPGAHALRLTDALRAALLSRIGEDIQPIISGHEVPPPHCAFLALPFVGSRFADGHIMGVAIALPGSAPEAVRQMRDALLAEDRARLSITLRNVPGYGPMDFIQPDRSTRTAAALHPTRWIRPSRQWRTVLPAVLDRAPSKRLSEKDAVLITLEHAGLPEPDQVLVLEDPFVRGDIRLRPHETLRDRADRIRPFRHLRIRFDRPVAGPLVVGALRHFGLGLCVPEAVGGGAREPTAAEGANETRSATAAETRRGADG